MDNKPTDKQLKTIRYIEKNIPYIKFIGATKKEASEFISAHLELSKENHKKNKSTKRRFSARSNSYNKPSNSNKPSSKSDYDRYEEYIRQISGNYAEIAGDDGWGGFAERDIARKMHPFEDWKRNFG